MKKVAKAILIALGIILVVGAVMVLGVNLYVQSAGTRARIERGLSKGLHTDVKIGRVSFMPWYGLRISAIERTDTGDGNTVRVEAISLKLRLWRLIRHDLVIKQL
ncbi:MAG TPA: hypothetical protein VG733_11665, partial [Chthoniobacteraceae bacterium]|nr:hypothetical protein [Chthoniobacteraceae bacterium]